MQHTGFGDQFNGRNKRKLFCYCCQGGFSHRVKTQKIFNGDLNAAKQNLIEQIIVSILQIV